MEADTLCQYFDPLVLSLNTNTIYNCQYLFNLHTQLEGPDGEGQCHFRSILVHHHTAPAFWVKIYWNTTVHLHL